MSDSRNASTLPPRIAALVERFDEIGETAMRGLPLYNPNLAVEAVGFRVVGDRWVGVLITPWFMNLIRLSEPAAPMDMSRVGSRIKVALPSGERELMQGGDEVIGAYESLSLHSPMSAFKTREAARQEARQRLAELMQPSEAEGPDEDGRLSLDDAPEPMSRRAFLGGTSSRA